MVNLHRFIVFSSLGRAQQQYWTGRLIKLNYRPHQICQIQCDCNNIMFRWTDWTVDSLTTQRKKKKKQTPAAELSVTFPHLRDLWINSMTAAKHSNRLIKCIDLLREIAKQPIENDMLNELLAYVACINSIFLCDFPCGQCANMDDANIF